MNIQQLIREQAVKYSTKTALIFKGEEISFEILNKNVLKLANALRAQGVEKGDKVGIFLPNSPEYVYSYLACFCLGSVVVPLDYMLKSDEIVSCLSHSEAKFLIAQPKNDVDLEQVIKDVPSLTKNILKIDKTENGSEDLDFSKLMEDSDVEFSEAVIQPDDPALIMYTSGTTGKPKGILLNYKHLDGSPRAMEYFVDLSDKDIKLAAIPFSHIAGFIYIQNCILFGITLVIMDRFNPYEFLRDITQYHVTCFHIVPAMYTAILSMKQIDKFDLSSLRWVVVFGAPNSPEIMERFHKYCPNAKLLNGWGMTETCPPNTVTPMGSTNIASVGKPSPHCEIRIDDEDNKPMAQGEIGEIVIKGNYIMECYYKDPEATAAMMNDGWLHTGDLGRFDEDGFLYIVGRKKEMIKVGGQIVYAPEVEAAFYKHEDVSEVAVIGVPDHLRGEVVKALVVLNEGADISSEDLRYFAKEHLAHFKVPHEIVIRNELPKNRTGKIDKESLERN
ncbi:MAG: AMP-binding protein [Candidatus Omnitrophica bacterium]|nr:AMP-binding protein [Candidatus Omnitrophota bacterium]